jgi:DNA-directed RNA polymerase alpha subunit
MYCADKLIIYGIRLDKLVDILDRFFLPIIQNWWIMKAEESWDTPIKQFVEGGEIPIRALHYFKQAGIKYPREVQWQNKPYPKMFRNFGKKTCEDVLNFIHNLGLKYQDE